MTNKSLSPNKDPNSNKEPMQNISEQGSNTTLIDELKHVIAQTKNQVQLSVNSHITVLYWYVGKKIQTHILKQERADYGKQIIDTVAKELSLTYGKGFSRANLRKMIQFYQAYPDSEIVSTLSRQLSWSHFSELLPIEDKTKRDFYVQMAAMDNWSVRTLRNRIYSMLFERTAISKKPDELIDIELKQLKGDNKTSSELSPSMLLKDPYVLDFLELNDTYIEKDLEDAILRELEQFLLELGSGFSFIGRQHRVQIGGEDFYIDLLFYNRKLKRLVALDLKIGEFKAAYKGQMELYLGYLAKYEQEPDEQAPLGIILCAGKNNEQVELLDMDKSGIHVADYLTALPSKEVLQQKLHQAIEKNRQRLSNRLDDSAGDNHD